MTNNTYSYVGIYLYAAAASSEARIWNNIVYDFNVGTEGSGIENYADNQTAYMYNNTVYNCITGIWNTAAGALVAKNNLVHTCGDDYESLSAGSDHNLGEEAAGGGTNYVQTTQTAAQIFVDPGGSPPDWRTRPRRSRRCAPPAPISTRPSPCATPTSRPNCKYIPHVPENPSTLSPSLPDRGLADPALSRRHRRTTARGRRRTSTRILLPGVHLLRGGQAKS